MQVELTVVGIRNYCEGGAEGYPQLFARLPIGTEVYLRINPPGTQYPGAVSVYDEEMQQIGSIGKTDRRFIELQIPQGGMLPVTISGHSARNNCLYVQAENTAGVKDPYIRQISTEPGEVIFALTPDDARLTQLTDMLRLKAVRLAQSGTGSLESVVRTAEQYVPLCCTSLDGDSSFRRADILMALRSMHDTYPALQPLWQAIYDQSKDLGRKDHDMRVRVYHEQYARIRTQALTPDANGHCPIEDYRQTLAFRCGGQLSREAVQQEAVHLSQLLAGELMGNYVKSIESDADFASALYSLNYSMHATYVLYTRRIKLEYLHELLRADAEATPAVGTPTENPSDDAPQTHYAQVNVLFSARIFTTEAAYAELHDTILAYVSQADAATATRQQIDPANRNEWYYVLKAISESGISSPGKLTDTNFVRQMMAWYPALFVPKQGEDEKTLCRHVAKSLSAERGYWRHGMDDAEVAIRDMWAHHHLRQYDQAKTMRLHGVAAGLSRRLTELKARYVTNSRP